MQQTKQPTMLFIITMVVAILFILLFIFRISGLLFQSEQATANDDTVKVTILTSDQVIDQSWGSLAYKGQLKIEELFPVEVTLYSELETDDSITQSVIESIENEAKVIIGHGREFSDIFTAFAPRYADIQFVTLHGTTEHNNQTVYTFNQGEIEYIAGIAAALKTTSNKVGLIDAFEARDRKPQFENALKEYLPDSSFYYKVVNSREDGKRAVQLVKELIEEGVDVIYSRGNAYNRDVIEYAKNHDIYVIGYLDDQSYIAEDLILTSVMNDVSQAYVSMMKDYFSSDGMPSGTVMLTEKDKVYKLAPFGPMFTEKEKQYIQTEKEKILQNQFY
ncbi:BMP family ABC transporter substrate-binding protein [Alkalihalobacillus sp. MEB130]|uniref:BMP family ABC transporter substrate-binding protein n=1 Tax=Alkalihalobacillus sp. MEB130 TaxID=2976704 RepID=UPI0028DDA827|nr:BMP family ABC transporter substrate-binding protein [Alkalihalobacillus sp. MEB130]MDT8861573.1 BMP family ABC transporter substrate-binding protein [Alkalihalobacillus sp. MEB130]